MDKRKVDERAKTATSGALENGLCAPDSRLAGHAVSDSPRYQYDWDKNRPDSVSNVLSVPLGHGEIV